jgi:prophage DNA circulation protein
VALLSGDLLPASFRGVPVAAVATALGGGRRLALHIYPGRDEPWAEDMGRLPRRFRIRGFLIEGDAVFLGGPIILQRALLTAALEKSGAGTFTSPTYGIVQLGVLSFSISEELDARRRSAVEIEFVEAGSSKFPTSILSTASGLLSASTLCAVALAVDGARIVALAIGAGEGRADVSRATTSWSTQVQALGGDATSLRRLAALLPGTFGRYAGGGTVGFGASAPSPYSATTTVSDLVAIASAARVAIGDAATALDTIVSTADLTNATDVANAITALVQALAAACADPSDAIRLMEQLLVFSPIQAITGTATGAAITAMFQRAAAASLTTAVGQYQPTSADDAAQLLASVAYLLDALATAAADAGDDQSYDALRAARLAIVQDLRARGANLSNTATFTIGQPIPALALAQRLYRDPTRADQLITQMPDVPNPLFMPTTFQALAA